MVATMHDLTLAAQYAERLLLLDDGAVAAYTPAGAHRGAPHPLPGGGAHRA
ncbi:MAG: hypothetical protein R2749_31110 [Acidimicrobiales bacterium]